MTNRRASPFNLLLGQSRRDADLERWLNEPVAILPDGVRVGASLEAGDQDSVCQGLQGYQVSICIEIGGFGYVISNLFGTIRKNSVLIL